MDTLTDIAMEALRVAPLLLLALAVIFAVGVAYSVRGAMRPLGKDLGWCLGRGEPTGPEDLGTTGRELTLDLTDENATTIAWDLDGQQPDGPAVLFVHGHSGSRYHALGMIAPLLPHASRIWTFDQRGHGDATPRSCTLGVREPADIVAVIAQVRQQLDETSPDTPLIVFGASMGAQSALAAVATHTTPGTVAGLALMGVYRKLIEPLPGHARRKGVPVWMFVRPTLAVLRCLLGPGIRFDRTADAAKLPCPLLLLHGEHDDLCPLASAQAIANAAQQAGVDTQLEVFPEGGHTRLYRTHSEQYTQTLAGFLQRFTNQNGSNPSVMSTDSADDAEAPEPPSENP
ncbi:MAG: alpha/beta fold hydrolase [Planctomycetota bacterium]